VSRWETLRGNKNGSKGPHSAEFREKIIALKGTASAAQIAEQVGISRCAVIGIWHRAKKQKVTA